MARTPKPKSDKEKADAAERQRKYREKVKLEKAMKSKESETQNKPLTEEEKKKENAKKRQQERRKRLREEHDVSDMATPDSTKNTTVIAKSPKKKGPSPKKQKRLSFEERRKKELAEKEKDKCAEDDSNDSIKEAPEKKKRICKIRFGLVDILDVETDAIVIPYYEDQCPDKNSIHHQMRKKFAPLVSRKRVDYFETKMSSVEWRTKMENLNSVKYDWNDNNNKKDTRKLIVEEKEQLQKVTLHVRPPIIKQDRFSVLTEAHLRASYLSSLIQCDKSQLQSVSFPILGHGVNRKQSVAIALQTIFAYLAAVEHTNIQLIYIVTRKEKHYDELGDFISWMREFDYNHWIGDAFFKFEEFIYNKIKPDIYFATIPGTDMIWRAFKITSHHKTKETNAALKTIHEKMCKLTGIKSEKFLVYSESEKKSRVMPCQLIQNGCDGTPIFKPNLMDIRYNMDNFCGSNLFLWKQWIISYYVMYYQDHNSDRCELNNDSEQCQMRKKYFHHLKSLHQFALKEWKHTFQNAPYKCNCTKEDGTHENLSVFLTKMSHHDEFFDQWTLNGRTVGFCFEEDVFDSGTRILYGKKKSCAAMDKKEYFQMCCESIEEWVDVRHQYFPLQKKKLQELVSKLKTSKVRNEEDPEDYDAEEFDDDITFQRVNQEHIDRLLEKAYEAADNREEMQKNGTAKEKAEAEQKYQSAARMLKLNRFAMHLNKDKELEQTLRNRLFRRTFKGYDDVLAKKTGSRKTIFTIDELISFVLEHHNIEPIEVSEEDESDRYAIPERTHENDSTEYPTAVYLGKRNVKCPFCGALSFERETIKKCCKKGAVWIPPLKMAPQAIKNIFTKPFRKYSISINTAFSMASISYTRQLQALKGVQSMKVKGSMSFHPSALHPNKAKPKTRYANFIVLDHGNDEIAKLRFYSLFNDKDHSSMKPLFYGIQKYLDENNTYYHLFKNMADLEKQYIEETGDEEVDNSKLQFRIVPIHDLEKKDLEALEHHPGVYADPSRIGTGYITVAYSWNSVDAAVIPRGLTIYPYNPKCGNQLPLSVFDDSCDKLCYPTFYPDGEGGWGLHKYERYTKKGPRPTLQQRMKEHIAKLKKEGKNPADYYVNYKEDLDDDQTSKKDDTDSDSLDIESTNGTQTIVNDSDSEEREKESLDPTNLNDEQILQHGKLEDEQQYPADGSIGQKANIRMTKINGELYPLLDKSKKTVDIGPAGDLFGSEDEDEIFRFDTEFGDDREFDEDFQDLQLHEEQRIVQEDNDEEQYDDEICYGDEHNAEPTALAQKNDGIRVKNVGKRPYVSVAEFGTFTFQQREEVDSKFHGQTGRLGQLYKCDLALRMKEQRAVAVTQHRAEFHRSVNRSKVFNFLQGMVNKQLGDNQKTLGMLVTMPSTVPGSPRYQRELVMGAITLANQIGRPNLFLTVTGNPKWKEIDDECKRLSCEWADVPELVCSVFKTKFDMLNDVALGKKVKKSSLGGKYVRENGHFGKVLWYSYSVEFQQRGMPHVHMVFTLEKPWTTIAEIDQYIRAEVPEFPDVNDVDYEEKKRYYNLVKQYMTHFPCEGDPKAYCNQGKKGNCPRCTKGFPQNCCFETTLRNNEYPQYRRTPGRYFEIYREGQRYLVGSEYVIAHSLELLMLLETHINLECIDSIKLFKYIFKYIYKGPDRVLLEGLESLKKGKLAPDAMTLQGNIFAPGDMNPGKVRQRQNDAFKATRANHVNVPEDRQIVINDCHYMLDLSAITACEAVWKLQGYPMHGSSHSVHRLYVHEENNETFFVKRGVTAEKAEQMLNEPSKGMMEAWFEQNRKPVDLPGGKKTTDLTLNEMPKYFSFDMSKQVFVPRKRDWSDHTFGRIQAPPPYLLELVATRILSMNVKGPRNWEELRTFNGVIYDTCLQAARAHRLMNGEKEWDDLLKEIGEFAHPVEIRRFFVSILVHCAPVNPLELFMNNMEVMLENKKSWTKEQKISHALRHIQFLLGCHKLTLDHFELGDMYEEKNLPKITKDVEYDNPNFDPLEPSDHKKTGESMYKKLNREQKRFVDRVLELAPLRNRSRVLFVEGPGGTGKTFCYQTVYHLLRAEGITLACVAHTGIAACLLPFGCTAHRSFSIPLEVNDRMRCRIVTGTSEGELLKLIGAVIWDEACMTDRRIYDAVDNLFQETYNNDLPFGGVLVILGGDWRQILPIVENIRGDGVAAYILKNSDLWKHVEQYELTQNQRAVTDPEFAKLILQIGDGSNYVNVPRKMVHIPKEFVIKDSEMDLINWVFPDVNDIDSTKNSAILTVDNKSALRINNVIVQQLNTKERVFISEDVSCKENGMSVDPEVFATQTPQGLPEHRLRLRIGAQVVLLRNLSVQQGLCNGTRLTVKSFEKDIIYCTVNNKLPNSPNEVFLHRIRMSPSGKETGLSQFTRLQYPIRLAYACTINKSQGQTLDRCGLMLHTPVFTHGQLYVAMSRVKKADDFRIWHYDRKSSDDQYRYGGILVRNVVFKDVLRKENVKMTLESIDKTVTEFEVMIPTATSQSNTKNKKKENEKKREKGSESDDSFDFFMPQVISNEKEQQKENKKTSNEPTVNPDENDNSFDNFLPQVVSNKKNKKLSNSRKNNTTDKVQKKIDDNFLRLENSDTLALCAFNTIANLLYSCQEVRELFTNRSTTDISKQRCNLITEIFKKETFTTQLWRLTLDDVNYHRGHQDIGEMFFFLMQDLLEEIRSIVPIQFEPIVSKTCSNCNLSETVNSAALHYSFLTIRKNDTFENIFAETYQPKQCSTNCQCGGQRTKRTDIHTYGKYHIIVLNHPNLRFKNFRSNARFKMFDLKWKLKSIAQYEPYNEECTKGHYIAWTRCGNDWYCINDQTVTKSKQKNLDLSKMCLKMLVFEKC